MASTPLGQVPSCKRRRVSAHTSVRPAVINDLSAEILKEVATYLAPPSRILFAVAITTRASPYETIMARSRSKKQKSPTIAGTDWATLDFGQIEKELAGKLSDKDVRDVLLHIDAANELKKLLLTNCTNITGSGLGPLSGSTTVEQIDLSLVGLSQDPYLIPKPPLSCDIVLPILDSIISNEAVCKLKYLHFPKAWRLRSFNAVFITGWAGSSATDLHAFLERYDQMLENHGPIGCRKCLEDFDNQYQPEIDLDNCSRGRRFTYGTQRNICHQCSQYSMCPNCPIGDDNAGLYFCSACEREYCENCVPMVRCSGCHNSLCVTCFTSSPSCASPNCDEKLCGGCKVANECVACNRAWCEECHLRKCYMCDFCDKICCDECSEKDNMNGVHDCDACFCDSIACSSCLLEQLQEGKLDCMTCIQRATPLIKQLKVEIEELKVEIEELKEEKEELHKRVQNLEERKQS